MSVSFDTLYATNVEKGNSGSLIYRLTISVRNTANELEWRPMVTVEIRSYVVHVLLYFTFHDIVLIFKYTQYTHLRFF